MNHRERGSALLICTIIAGSLATISLTLLTLIAAQVNSTGLSMRGEHALEVADGAISHAIEEIRSGADPDGDGVGNLRGTMGRVRYAVRSSRGAGEWTIVAVAADGRTRRAIEVVLQEIPPSPVFAFGVFGDEYVRLDSNTIIDSYDSARGTYASQAGSRFRGQRYANPNGDTGSNGPITLASNAILMGSATAGPGQAVTRLSNAHVAGASTSAAVRVVLPPIRLPAVAALPPTALRLLNNTSLLLPSGLYHFSNLTVDSNSVLTIRGPATIVVDYFDVNSNSSVVFDTVLGPIHLYGTGHFNVNSNSSVSSTTRDPADLRISITTNNIADPSLAVGVDSNASMTAVVYAPNAEVSLDSNGQILGSVVARRIRIDSNFRLHYDEALRRLLSPPRLRVRVISWRLIPAPPMGA